jgi:hypothetical protein
MVSRSNGTNPKQVVRFNWPTQLYTVLIGLVLFVVIETCQADTALLIYIFVVPILLLSCIVLLICAAISKNRRRYLQQLLTLTIFLAISIAVFVFDDMNPIAIRSTARWLIWSRDYKAQVLRQTPPANGELKHMEWDGWGMFAQNTSVFLVFDPTDSLSGAAKSHQSGKFNGIPCEVPLVRRLESHWYTVVFYTSQGWDECN